LAKNRFGIASHRNVFHDITGRPESGEKLAQRQYARLDGLYSAPGCGNFIRYSVNRNGLAAVFFLLASQYLCRQ
jgi:hypothetical protein